jgi:peptidoglycan/LPS O-acetylase OafA/YrhL
MISNIQLLRFTGTLAIIIFHYSPFRNVVIDNLNQFVPVFFVLSGYFMEKSLASSEKKSPLNILLKRLFKIVPLYLVILFPYLALSSELLNVKILHVFLIQSWYPDSNVQLALNAPAWFVSVQVFFYLVSICLKKLNSKWLIITQYFILLSHLILSSSEPWLFYFPLSHLHLFLFGMRLYRDKKICLIEKYFGYTLFFWTILFNHKLLIHNGGGYVIIGQLLLFLVNAESRIFNEKFQRRIVALGDATYSIYIVQALIAIPFSKFNLLVTYGGFFFYVIICLLVGLLVYQGLEIPISNWFTTRYRRYYNQGTL